MTTFDKITSFDVPDGTTTLFGFNESDLKELRLLDHPKGIILFIHGFNSSAQIWGDEKTGFVSESVDKRYIPFVIDLSNSINGSIINLADYDVFKSFNYIQDFLGKEISKNIHPEIHFVAHSMGGIILRYFLSTHHKHKYHNPADFKKLNFKSVALLAVPNHGISKSNSDNFVAKMDKLIQNFNSLAGEKFSIKLVNKAFYQLLTGNSIIDSLLQNLDTNMWTTLYWMNFIADKDIVVDHISSYFPPDQISYLENNFYQTNFDATHMKNPFQTFTDAVRRQIPFSDSSLYSKIEQKTNFLGFLTKDPIYANKDLIKDYFNHINQL